MAFTTTHTHTHINSAIKFFDWIQATYFSILVCSLSLSLFVYDFFLHTHSKFQSWSWFFERSKFIIHLPYALYGIGILKAKSLCFDQIKHNTQKNNIIPTNTHAHRHTHSHSHTLLKHAPNESSHISASLCTYIVHVFASEKKTQKSAGPVGFSINFSKSCRNVCVCVCVYKKIQWLLCTRVNETLNS